MIFRFPDAGLGINHFQCSQCGAAVGHLYGIAFAHIRKINGFSVIFGFHVALYPKQAQICACIGFHGDKQIPVLHQAAGCNSARRCAFFRRNGYICSCFCQFIVGFYRKNCHFRTGDVCLGIKFIVGIPYHQVCSVQQFQIRHCCRRNRIFICIAQRCAGFRIIAADGIQCFAEDHAHVFSVCRLCIDLVGIPLQFVQICRGQDLIFQRVGRCLVGPVGNIVGTDDRFPFGHCSIADISAAVNLHNGIHQLYGFAVSHVISGLTVFLAVFVIAAHQPQFCCFFQKRLEAGPCHGIDICKGSPIGRHCHAPQNQAGRRCKCNHFFHMLYPLQQGAIFSQYDCITKYRNFFFRFP